MSNSELSVNNGKGNRKVWFYIACAVLIAALIIGAVLFTGKSETIPGSTGAKWHFNGLTNTLVISGTGSVPSYISTDMNDPMSLLLGDSAIVSRPWNSHLNKIKKIIVKDGIIGIGNYAFFGCPALEKVTLENVVMIGDCAFAECDVLSEVSSGSHLVSSISSNAFDGCEKLTHLHFEGVDRDWDETDFGLGSLADGSENIASEPLSRGSKMRSITFSDIDHRDSVMDFHRYRRDEIESVTFLDTLDNIGAEAQDISENHDGSVMTWVAGKDLFIAGDGGVIACESTGEMFAGYSNMTRIDFGNCFDTSETTDMHDMFYGCSKLEAIDVSGFNTANVTDMSGLFCSCKELTSLDLSNFDTSNVVDMDELFSSCKKLTTLDISSFDTSSVIGNPSMASGFSRMFKDCCSLTSLDLRNFDTSNAITMFWMFYGCSSLTSLNLSSFDTAQVANMKGMFRDCSSLTSLDLSSFDTAQVADMSEMFQDCSSLTSLDLSNFDTANVDYSNSIFEGCVSLESVNNSILEEYLP